jgi:hypothetical protein
MHKSAGGDFHNKKFSGQMRSKYKMYESSTVMEEIPPIKPVNLILN